MSKKHKNPIKPTGRTGPILVKFSAEGASAEFQPIQFPESKEKIEEFIASGFIVVGSKLEYFSAKIQDVKANPMDDWDFIIKTDSGEKWLELMELAPFDQTGGKYENAPSSYNPYNFAKYILNKVMGKSEHYYKPIEREIWLLVYITAWQFFPSQPVIELLQYWTCNIKHVFNRIYMFKPTDKYDGILWCIYPTNKKDWEEKGFNPELYQRIEAINIDPQSWTSE